MTGEDLLRTRVGGHVLHQYVEEAPDQSATGLARIADQRLDGVDAEVVFPNGPALLMFGSSDPGFVDAQFRIWNDWAMEVCGPFLDRCLPVAAVQTADIDLAIAEVERCAAEGFRAVTLPNKPIWGPHHLDHPNYNLRDYDPLWATIQECELTITFHVSTGMDPRTARGDGGAIVSYVIHSLSPTIEPIVNLCSSGVFERFPTLRAGTIEANAGWVPFVLDSMDEAYRKHHFWVRPVLDGLPSEYYRANCFASVGEDRSALLLAREYDLVDNLMFANDYPHHEGSWPHSAESIAARSPAPPSTSTNG